MMPAVPVESNSYIVDIESGIGIAIGDKASITQNIEAVYQIYTTARGGARITARLKGLMDPILRRHELFGGRNKELAHLSDFVSQKPKGYFFVTGPSGYGKSALLVNWLKLLRAEKWSVCYQFCNRQENTARESFVFKNLCEQLADYHQLHGALPESVETLSALYADLLRIPPQEGQYLLIIFDGLDEIILEQLDGVNRQRIFSAPFQVDLPNNVFVIFSARKTAGRDWLGEDELNIAEKTEMLDLDALDRGDITDLLQKSGGMASSFSKSLELVDAVYGVSRGDPFYLYFLIKDILSGVITKENISSQPTRLNQYLDRWWTRLLNDIEVEKEKVKDIFGILAVAHGQLKASDFEGISGRLTEDIFRSDRPGIEMLRYLVGNHNIGYALLHPRFREYLNESIFSPDKLQTYRTWLLDYCKRWQEHKSEYALTYYTTHLFELEEKELLYGLICKSWMEAQYKRVNSHLAFADDIKRALSSAHNERPQNVVQILRCCLLIATLGALATSLPPEMLGVLAHIGQTKRAIDLASLIQEPEQIIKANIAIYEALVEHHQNEQSRKTLEFALSKSNSLQNKVLRARVLIDISKMLARLGQNESATKIANDALDATKLIDKVTIQNKSMSNIAEIFAQAKEYDQSMAITGGLNDETTKVSTFSNIILFVTDDIHLEYIEGQVATINHENLKIRLLTNLAIAFAKRDKVSKAVTLIQQASSITEFITNTAQKTDAVSEIGNAWAWVKSLEGTEQVLDTMPDRESKLNALSSVAQIFAQNGDTETATALIERIIENVPLLEKPSAKISILTNTAKTLAILRNFDLALELATQIIQMQEQWPTSEKSAIELISALHIYCRHILKKRWRMQQ